RSFAVSNYEWEDSSLNFFGDKWELMPTKWDVSPAERKVTSKHSDITGMGRNSNTLWGLGRVERAMTPLLTTSTTSLESVECRTQKGYKLPWQHYVYDTCASCYLYMPIWAFKPANPKFWYLSMGRLKDPLTNITYLAETTNRSHPIFNTFLSKCYVDKWVSCCEAARECCQKMATTENIEY
ncbi:uncharacterized protein LOC111084584, partial [Limulus polyphemus]|uniref:Uncharacterized protein LOC111084584 n=1 Tax=Limulus polyphemus TaxID=6850 RepID=A0ABM1S006_LIMPO